MLPRAMGTLEHRSISPSLEGCGGGGCSEQFEITAVVTVSAGAAETVATEAKVVAAPGLDAFLPAGAIPENRGASPVDNVAAMPTSFAGDSPEMVFVVNNCCPLLLLQRIGGKMGPRVDTNSIPSAEGVALTGEALSGEAPFLLWMGAAMMGATPAAAVAA